MNLPKIPRVDEIENLYKICTQLYETSKNNKKDDDDIVNPF